MEDLPLGRIAALVPEFAVKDLPLGRTHDDDILKLNFYYVITQDYNYRLEISFFKL